MIYQGSSGDASRAAISIGLGGVALLSGFVVAFFGWEGQVLLLTVALPATLLFVDYRYGLLLAIMLLPYNNAKFLPSAGPLTVINVLLLGVFVSFLIRWVRTRLIDRPLAVPVPRELVLWYWLPITIGMVIGTFHLGDISIHYLRMNEIHAVGVREYWVGLYVKAMLLVATACILGAAVVENAKAMRFMIATVVSGVLFVGAMVMTVVSTGATLQQLQQERGLLEILGRHNTEASVLLLGVLAPTLFMREFVKRPVSKFVLLICVLTLVSGLLLTMSRGGVAGFLVVLGLFVWHFRRPRLIVAVLAVAVITFALTPAAIQDRLLLGLENSAGRPIAAQVASGPVGDNLTMGRVWLWSLVAGEIEESPLYGRGVTSIQWSSAAKRGMFHHTHPHSVYLEVLMDLGILGAVCIGAFYVFVWRLFKRLSRDERVPPAMRGWFVGSAAGLLGMLTYGLTNGHYYPAPEQLYFWISVGLALGYRRWLMQQPSPVLATKASARGASSLAPARM